MPERTDVQAAIMMVAGEWARYLDTIDPRYRRAASVRLHKRYMIICRSLQKIHDVHFPVKL